MLTREQNDRLTRVGPGTPMGALMRRYWHPVAAVSQLKDRATMPIRVLCEDLVLYKDRSGTYGAIEPTCPHRRMGMLYGVPEEHGLRCAYHGWLFDETGRCLEQPYEQAEDPESTYKDKVRARTYPVQEYAGMLWIYMGPAPAPLLPAFDLFVQPNMLRDIGYAQVPCNWLQCEENSLDPVHVQWLHQHFANYVMENLGRHDLIRPPQNLTRIAFDVFEYGIIKRRMVEGGTEEDPEWTTGQYALFPYWLRQGAGGRDNGGGFQIRVPRDDETTNHWWYRSYPMKEGDQPQAPADIPFYKVPVPDVNAEGYVPWDQVDNNSGQDLNAWYTQGAIANRTRENLGRSDRGIILFRRMLEENLQKVERGEDPMNVFRDPEKNKYIEFKCMEAPFASAAALPPSTAPSSSSAKARSGTASAPCSAKEAGARAPAFLITACLVRGAQRPSVAGTGF